MLQNNEGTDMDPDLAQLNKLRVVPASRRLTAYQYRYKMYLDSVTARITAASDPVFVRNVCDCWLEYFENKIADYTATSSSSFYMNNLIAHMVAHNVVKDFVGAVRTRNILTWITLTLAVDAQRGLQPPLTDNIKNLLMQWSGQDLPNARLDSLQDITDLLYGAGVWDLYATEVDQAFKAPTHLYAIGLVSRKSLCAPSAFSASPELPDNLSY